MPLPVLESIEKDPQQFHPFLHANNAIAAIAINMTHFQNGGVKTFSIIFDANNQTLCGTFQLDDYLSCIGMLFYIVQAFLNQSEDSQCNIAVLYIIITSYKHQFNTNIGFTCKVLYVFLKGWLKSKIIYGHWS